MASAVSSQAGQSILSRTFCIMSRVLVGSVPLLDMSPRIFEAYRHGV